MAVTSSNRADSSGELAGMPPPLDLRVDVLGDEVVVCCGGRVLACYERGDRGMRNLAIVSLTRAGVKGVEVAALFGVRPEHVSRLRRLAGEGGSAALLPPTGRPTCLDEKGIARVYTMADNARTGRQIAAELRVSAATISRVLKHRPPREANQLDMELSAGETDQVGEDQAGSNQAETGGEDQAGGEDHAGSEDHAGGGQGGGGGCGIARIGDGVRSCGYAGAMLLHSFLDRAGAGAILSALPSGLARRYDAACLMCCATFGFVLGVSSAEGTKHLLAADAGALVGVERFPHLRTLRPRLSKLADVTDPIGIQTALAKAMLDADDTPPEVFFVDDHFVAYSGSAPVGKGWNTRRRHAEPGRDDTVIVDDTWRAICFASGPPSGLSTTMFGPLEALRRICGDRPVTIGFDRGGAYPKVFAQLNTAGFDWVTYRRAPLAAPTVTPRRSWVNIDGHRHYLSVADETVTVGEVGEVRQISIFESATVALQILTSDTETPAAALAARLRGRWCIENTFKYLEDHQGIHWLCDYRKNIGPNTTKIANPKRVAARAALKTAQVTVDRLHQAIGIIAACTPDDPSAPNEQLVELNAELATAQIDLDTARTALKPIPAKLAATDINPDAKRAQLATNRRSLQMVCRLLAYNAELDLARALNNYLCDPDEYRAITRNLLHQPGTITYTPTAITVAIQTPDAPRIARALQHLTNQLNTNPPRLAGDNRPINYKIIPKP